MKTLTWPSVGLALVVAIGCISDRQDRIAESPPIAKDASQPPRIERIDYAESEGFDLQFETALVNRQPAITIQTEFTKPEWGMRLNNWIAAWNAGHRNGFRARGQLPVSPSIVVDGDSIREFRFLVDDLMSRVDETAKLGGLWWAEKNMRERRIALLKPYNLRFHLDAENRIQLIFCHSDYAAQHKEIVRSIADPEGNESLEWFSGYRCSRSRSAAKKVVNEQ